MKRTLKKIAVMASLCSPLAGTEASAGGFLIYEHSARATALAGALAARGGDPSVIFYNPAALASLKGTHFSIGATLIFPTGTFAGANPFPGFGVTEDYKDRVLYPSNFYVSHQLSENLAAGLAIFNPYGLVVDWVNPESFSGRYISFKSMLRSFYFNPTIAYKLNAELSVAAGLQAVYSEIELNRINGSTVNGRLYDTAKIHYQSGSGIHFGFNGGVRFEATDKLRLGAAYRSAVEVEFDDGEATFTQIPISESIDPAVAASLPKNQKAITSITLPAILSLGVGYQVMENLDLEFDAVLNGWSSFDELAVSFPETPSLNSIIPQNWQDVWSYRLGMQYQWNERLALRAGYVRDLTPQPKASMSPLLPDADRHEVAFGFGYQLTDSITLDLANLLVFFDERTTDGLSRDNFNGEYRVFAYALGVNFTYHF